METGVGDRWGHPLAALAADHGPLLLRRPRPWPPSYWLLCCHGPLLFRELLVLPGATGVGLSLGATGVDITVRRARAALARRPVR